MVKKKFTLSIDEELIKGVKLIAQRENVSLSNLVEEYFEYLVLVKWVDSLAEELSLGELEPTTESKIPSSRPARLDAAKVVRELRSSRA